MQPRTYAHGGRRVQAMRFVGNGRDVAKFAAPFGRADGEGLSGSLRIGGQEVECGDWVTRDGAIVGVVRQEHFVCRYREVRHADKQ